jgi:hypothetical protein
LKRKYQNEKEGNAPNATIKIMHFISKKETASILNTLNPSIKILLNSFSVANFGCPSLEKLAIRSLKKCPRCAHDNTCSFVRLLLRLNGHAIEALCYKPEDRGFDSR